MAIYNAGNAYLQILPSFRGIEKLMQRETRKLAEQIDKSVARGANEGIIEAFRSVNLAGAREVRKAAQETGDKWASVFEQRVGQNLREAAAGLPTFEPKVKLNRFDRAIKQTQRDLNALAQQKIGPTGDVSFDQLGERLDYFIRRMQRLAGETKNAQQQMRLMATEAVAQELRTGLNDARQRGLADGRSYGGAYAQGAKQTIEQSMRALPEINLDADTTPAERAIESLRGRLVELSQQRIGIDIDRDAFQRELQEITREMDAWAQTVESAPLRFDLEQAVAPLRRLAERVSPVVEEQMEEVAEDAAVRFAGAFVDSTRRNLETAIRQIPEIEITGDSSDAERELDRIRQQLVGLNARVGVDMDAAQVQAEIDRLLLRLQALDSDDVTIDVRTNAQAAAAEIRQIATAADESSMSMIEFSREVGISMSRLGYLIIIGASMGSIIAPAATTAAVAIAGMATAAAGALAAFGALAFGMAGIADAVGKIDKYQQDADKSARSFSQAQNRVISATNQVKQAEQSLADARQDAADANLQAQQRIADAQRNVARAQRDAAESIRRARENAKDAIADVAEARRDAAEAIEDALESQEDAQRSLTRANKDAKEAREELNQALKDAVQDLRELDTAVKRNANEISKAQTDAMKAKLELDKILTNPRASEIEKRMAREKYQEQLIQIEELKNKQVELGKQQADAAKNGVESTERVKDARERLAAADERAADAQRRLDDARERVVEAQLDGMKRVQDAEKRAAEAQRAVAKAQADGAERVADAQRAVADAQRDAIRTARNGNRQIEAGQQRVADANRGLQQSYEGLRVAGGEAFDAMNDALDKLSPAGRRFAEWLYNLKPYLQQLRSTAQNGLLPGFQDGLQILVNEYLPEFDAFLGKISRGLGNMFRATAQVFTLPQWRDFFSFISERALPSLQGAWVATLNLARGVANLVRALNPLAEPIGAGLVDMTERFAQWSDRLATNPSFQNFLEYARDVGPRVVTLISEMVEFIGRLIVAMAPIGSMLINLFTATFQWLNSWDIDTLTAVVEIVAVLATGILLLTGFVRTVKFVTEVWTATSLLAAKAQGILSAAVVRYNTATVTATASTGLLNGRLFATQAAGAAGASGMAAMSAAAGPLGVALAGIGAIWAANYYQQKKANEATDELAGGFQELAEAYKTAAEGADRSGTLIADTFTRVVQSNPDMKETVTTLTGLGASLDDIAGAAAGSAEQLDKVLDLIDRRIEQLRQQQKDNFFSLGDNEEREIEMERLYKLQERLKESGDQAKLTSEAMKILNDSQRNVGISAQMATPAELALAEAHRVLSDESATATQKMDALKRAEDAIREGAVNAIEAEEQWSQSLINLRSQIDAAKEADDKHATSLSMKTQTGLRNRDMLENLIQSANRMYDADVALNGVTQAAIDKGKGHIDQIRKVAKELGLNKTETDKLIKSYRTIPEDVNTAVNLDEKSFKATYVKLQRMQWMQTALRLELTPAEAEAMWNRRDYPSGSAGQIPSRADGGLIEGPGTPTSDSILARLSNGEFVQRHAAVDYYGTGFMEAINQRLIPREILPGFATGGFVGQLGSMRLPMTPGLAKVWVPTAEDIEAMVLDDVGGGPLGNLPGRRGYRWQMQVLRKVFPGLRLISGYRPGARTRSGNLSWHGRDGGRAVDIPPRMDVFNWIRGNYGKGTKELIWGGAPNANIKNGRTHRFDEGLLRSHGPYKGKPGPSPHIHWAYDEGGWLPPGFSTVFNGTGKPEPVLTSPQWEAIISDRGAGGGPTRVYNIEFAENKLTLADLAAHERRQAALDRVGRPR